MTDQEPSAAKPRSRFRLIIQTTVLLVVGIFYYLLKGIDLGHVWAEIQAMTWTEDAALAAIAAWNLATYGLVWMSVTPGLGQAGHGHDPGDHRGDHHRAPPSGRPSELA
jgi:hypothetical protein